MSHWSIIDGIVTFPRDNGLSVKKLIDQAGEEKGIDQTVAVIQSDSHTDIVYLNVEVRFDLEGERAWNYAKYLLDKIKEYKHTRINLKLEVPLE